MRVLRTHGWSASKVMPGFFHHRDLAGTDGLYGDDFMAEGSDVLLDRLDRVMKDEFDAKILGCGSWPEICLLQPCCLDLQTLEL